ncbi:hypothetical protein [Sphingomonas sp. BK235]|uniref:hypothetical protein n=1 Tax=Sphingomonas sp. BK235 TaxID=2512131 RepID=UPI001044DBB1|nr:hypothetical protein [Sphingomonas sp. BK235]
MGTSIDKHFAAWCRLGGARLVEFTMAIQDVVVAPLLERGFRRVTRYMEDPSDVVPVRQIRLERSRGEKIDGITFNFDKYRHPSCQIHIEQRIKGDASRWLRAANVVKRPAQYICFWGAPWWLPKRLWMPSHSRKTAQRLHELVPVMLVFLEDGQLSRNLRLTATREP